jgi:hypothetical protein
MNKVENNKVKPKCIYENGIMKGKWNNGIWMNERNSERKIG